MAHGVWLSCESVSLPRYNRAVTRDRQEIGAAAERIAAGFLRRRGIDIVDSNVAVGRGEVDLIGRLGRRRIIFEVRSVTTGGNPVDAFDRSKADQLWRLSSELGIGRVDLVAVGFSRRFVTIHWIPHIL